jgi:hypothetical protein
MAAAGDECEGGCCHSDEEGGECGGGSEDDEEPVWRILTPVRSEVETI